jgi:NAD(P)-dependent dehydrogenase (short-subunit alcohol dehydrogenase family)
MSFLSSLLSVKAAGIAGALGIGIYFAKKYFSGGQFNKSAVGTDLKDKRVIITGANTGIGLECAVELVNLGANVVIACRDEKRANDALATIRARTASNAGAGKVEFMSLDLSDLNSVREFTAEYKAKHDRLHVLLNNAGIMMCPEWKTVQGFEVQFGTNHLGHFLLTTGLLDTLKASAPARIVRISSIRAGPVSLIRSLTQSLTRMTAVDCIRLMCRHALTCVVRSI